MNGANNKSSPASDAEKAMVIALIGLAAGLLAGLLSFFNSLLAALGGVGQFWGAVLCAGTFTLLTASIVIGGRGYAYGPKRSGFWNRFNLQALMGLAAVVLIVALFFLRVFAAQPSPADLFAKDLNGTKSNLEAIGKQLAGLERRLSSAESDLARLRSDAASLVAEVAAAPSLTDGVNHASASLAAQLNSIAGALKEISESIQKHEKAAP